MKNPGEPVIDFPIERINKFLQNYTFEVPLHYDLPKDIKLPIKVKLIGMKNFISVGDWTPYITYEFSILLGNKTQNFMSSLYFFKENMTEIPYEINIKNRGADSLINNLSELLRNFLQYWGVNYRVNCERGFSYVPFNIDTENLNESLILESKYDGIVRKLVKDIIGFVKYGQTGEFSLPEDISGMDMVYEFPQLDTKFSVDLTIAEDENVDNFTIDSEFYVDEDVIELQINLNPNSGRSILQDLIGELNETLTHELVHIHQHENDYDFPDDEDLTPLEYYTQDHEIEAQYRGFKRRAKKEYRTIENVMDEWFDKNKNLHRLTPDEVEIVKEKILDLYY